MSLKRKSRSMIGLLLMKVSRGDQKRPQQFRKFFRLQEKKIDLVKFLINDSLQGQADTKMLLYAHHFWCWIWNSQHCYSTNRCGYLGNVFFVHVQGKIHLQLGTLYDLSENSLHWSLIQFLPGLHAFSGCDTTRCFERKHFWGCFEARSKLLTKKKKPPPPRSLPPT